MSLPPADGARLGPKAAEDEMPPPPTGPVARRGLGLKALLPNAITAAALCSGLTGIRFAIGSDWSAAVAAVILAGLLDGIDGRVARLLNAQSRFGAELDSLADSLSFGTAPALVIYLWTLNEVRIGWFASLALAIACALRLARFNAQIDVDIQPHKSAGFLTGIPAPVAAGLSFLPFYLWQATGLEIFSRAPASGAVGSADRLPDDFEPGDAQLGCDAPAAHGAIVGDPVGRTGVRGPAARAVVDAGGYLPGLSCNAAGRLRALRPGQAAARSGVALE